MIRKLKQTKNFIKLETRNPINDPQAEFSAFLVLLLLKIISATNAPTKGPIKKPNGGKNNSPKINPIVAPQAPYLLPPYFLVPMAGKK